MFILFMIKFTHYTICEPLICSLNLVTVFIVVNCFHWNIINSVQI
jgi:hypothetical protein